jgi:hypothetical protein
LRYEAPACRAAVQSNQYRRVGDAFLFEKLVQLVPDGRPAYDFSTDVGHQQRLRNQASWKVHASAVPGQGLETGTPWHRGLKAKAKGEFLRCHHLMSGPECRLVIGAGRAEPQGRAHWLPAVVCRISCPVTGSG